MLLAIWEALPMFCGARGFGPRTQRPWTPWEGWEGCCPWLGVPAPAGEYVP